MKTILIGNKRFEVIKTRKALNTNYLSYYAGRTLEDCYTKPSIYKVTAYNEWLRWANDNCVYHFGVRYYNSFGFTLQGLIEYEGKTYILEITPKYNKALVVQ